MIAPLPPLPSPSDLGFPAHFSSWRPDQLAAIDQIIRNPKRFSALTLSTGAGKSIIGIGAALLHPEVTRALYLTCTKGLQVQLYGDFGQLGLVDIKGQRNYPCRSLQQGQGLDHFRRHTNAWAGCDEGPCHAGVPCQEAPDRRDPFTRPSCEYYGAQFDATQAQLVSTNYAYWLACNEYGAGIGDFDLLICDEAHDADKELESFLTYEVSKEDAQFVHSRFPQGDEIEDWVKWGGAHVGRLKKELETRAAMPPSDAEGVQDMRRLKAVLGKMEKLADMRAEEWVIEREGATIARFSPLQVSKYAEEYLFRGIKRVVLTSATLTRKTTQLLGVPYGDLHLWECPSRFPVDRRPVIHLGSHPPVRVDHRMHDSTRILWRRRIDRLIEARAGRKGIIHTVSYARGVEIYTNSEHKGRMIVHDRHSTLKAVAEFKSRRDDCILVSPSVMTGFDFPGQECRFQIIAKVPMPDIRGAILTNRCEVDPEYRGYLAMQKLVQAVGRGMRSEGDWCETIIVDDNIGWAVKKYRKHLPQWFIDAYQTVEFLPQPLTLPTGSDPP